MHILVSLLWLCHGAACIKIKTDTHHDKTDQELIQLYSKHTTTHVLLGSHSMHHNIRTPFATTYYTTRPSDYSVVITVKADAFLPTTAITRHNGYSGQASTNLHLVHHQKANQVSGELSVSAVYALLVGGKRELGRWQRRWREHGLGGLFEARVFRGGQLVYECVHNLCNIHTIHDHMYTVVEHVNVYEP